MRPLPRPRAARTLGEGPGVILQLLGVLGLLLGLSGEPLSVLPGLTTLHAAASQHPEVLVDALPMGRAARVALRALTLNRGLALQPSDLPGGGGRVAVHHPLQPIALRPEL